MVDSLRCTRLRRKPTCLAIWHIADCVQRKFVKAFFGICLKRDMMSSWQLTVELWAHVSSTYILMSRAHTFCLRTRHYHTNNIWHQWRFFEVCWPQKVSGKLVVKHFRLSNFTFYLIQSFWATYHVTSCHQNRRFSSWIVGCLNNVTCATGLNIQLWILFLDP